MTRLCRHPAQRQISGVASSRHGVWHFPQATRRLETSWGLSVGSERVLPIAGQHAPKWRMGCIVPGLARSHRIASALGRSPSLVAFFQLAVCVLARSLVRWRARARPPWLVGRVGGRLLPILPIYLKGT
jgi:hypothetical protein